MRPERPKPKHHLRQVTAPEVIERIKADDWTSPVGGQDTQGNWWMDTKLPRTPKR